MINTFVLSAVCLWTLIYTASYAVHEYNEGNKSGAFAVSALCLALVFFAFNTLV